MFENVSVFAYLHSNFVKIAILIEFFYYHMGIKNAVFYADFNCTDTGLKQGSSKDANKKLFRF
jgi:hypothetical protein